VHAAHTPLSLSPSLSLSIRLSRCTCLQPLDQATGTVLALAVGSSAAGFGRCVTGDVDASLAAVRHRTEAALSELGITDFTSVLHPSPSVFPIVDVTDAAIFKSTLPLYPQGVALGLVAWRRAQRAQAGKPKL
jgi:hypothetical protein